MESESHADDEKISMLLAMGFPDVGMITHALKASSGDINEAVTMLTDNNLSSYATKDDLSKVADEQWNNAATFPSSVARTLHNSVFADSWNIPYRKNEALGLCLQAATNLAKQGLCQSDSGCKRFLEELLPECFNKLMDAVAVRRWTMDVQQGVFSMVDMLLDLAVAALQTSEGPVPQGVMHSLAEVFCSTNEFHMKNRSRTADFPASTVYAASLSDYHYGWLVDVLNMFGDRGGFDALLHRLAQPELQLAEAAFLMRPFSVCSSFLSPTVLWPSLCPIVEKTVDRLSNMNENDLKSSDSERCFQLLESCQHICSALWHDQLERVTNLRFHLIYTMIRMPHFSARINALKGLGKLISESERNRLARTQTELFDIDYVQNWMTEKRILFYALNGNLDQIQYTERMRELMDILAPKLREEDLSRIWQLVDRAASPQVVDNIHAMLEVAAKRFSPQQFEYILKLLCKSFESGGERLQEKLLSFLGNVGRDNRLGRTAETMLDVVWDLARRPELPGPLVDMAMKQHLHILSHAATRDTLRRDYMVRCITDIKRSPAVYLPLKQLHVLAQSLTKGSHGYFKTEKAMLADICTQHHLLSLVTSSLGKCHQLAVQKRGGRCPLPGTLIDGKYTHQQYLSAHMEFLQFLLKDGERYLPSKCAKEIWDTLVANPTASTYDQETCFQLLCTCLEDLESSSQREVLLEHLLHLPPASLTPAAYTCLLAYWSAVNVADRKLTKLKGDGGMVVESLDVLGREYFWRILLECSNREIVNEAANVLLALAYFDLSHKLKKSPAVLHQRFIKDCHRRLDKVLYQLSSTSSTATATDGSSGGGAVASVVHAVSNATNTLTAMAVNDAAEITPTLEPRWLMVQVERMVCLTCEYISRVEGTFCSPRSLVSHAATLHGTPLLLRVTVDVPAYRVELTVPSHSHESIRSLRCRLLAAVLQRQQQQREQQQSPVVPQLLTPDQITQLIFVRSSKQRSCSDCFAITPSKTSPWAYKHESKDGYNSVAESGTCNNKRRTSSTASTANDVGDDKNESGEVDGEKILVTCGEKENTLLYELGIEDSCQLKLVINAAGGKSVTVKEVSFADHWNELPGPASYADTVAKDDSNFNLNTAVIPYNPPSAVVNDSTATTDSSNNSDVTTATTTVGGGGSGGIKTGILEKVQNFTSTNRVSNTSNSSGGGGGVIGSIAAAVAATAGSTEEGDVEKTLPGVLMAEKGSDVFEMLFRLGRIEDVNIMECSRRLLLVIPTHAELLDRLDAVTSSLATDSAGRGVDRTGVSPASSPAKRETLRDREASSVQHILQALLDPRQPGMTAFRLLYNLEAVASKLVRVGVGMGEDTLSRRLCAEFLRCGGLRLLCELLQLGRPSQDLTNLASSLQHAQALLYRRIHYRALLVLKHLICGMSSKQEILTATEEDDDSILTDSFSSTPNSTLCEGIIEGGSAGLPCFGPARPALLLLPEEEWRSLVCGVMQAVWHGAARKLNIAGGQPGIHGDGGCGEDFSTTAAGGGGVGAGQQAVSGQSPDNIFGSTSRPSCDPKDVSVVEASITSMALAVLVSVLASRTNLLGVWYALPGLRAYLLELVLGCSSAVVRGAACRQLKSLTRLSATSADLHPKLFVSQVLVKAPLPLWVSTCHARGAALKIISQSHEYFKLRSYLLSHLGPVEERMLGISVRQMLDDEVSWLSNFTLTRPRSRHRPESEGVAARRSADDTLCAGHLILVRALLSAPGLDLYEYGQKLIPLLLEVYLFPAAVMLQQERNVSAMETAVKAYSGKCCGTLSRQQAYSLLLQLSTGHSLNLASVCSRLHTLHHTLHPQAIREWEIVPALESRASSGFVGLRNGGATCYMNSVLQQLFLVPGVREDLLAVSLPDHTQESLLYQLQTVFGHLLESEYQFFEPMKFWESFRMDGRPVNIREQQDAFEFYTRLVEQVDDYLKSKSLERVFAKRFEGVFSIQRLCQDCPHRFEREEAFLSLNLTVKKLDSLHSSLDQLVKGELLEGDNACYCDVCHVKGRALVRTCIKKPPQVLTIQLKRFGYDYDNGRSVKYDDHYKFPWSLDLSPYTADYLAELEGSTVKKNTLEGDDLDRSTSLSPIKMSDAVTPDKSSSSSSSGSVADASPAEKGVSKKHDVISVGIKDALMAEMSTRGRSTSSSNTIGESRSSRSSAQSGSRRLRQEPSVGLVDEDTEMTSPNCSRTATSSSVRTARQGRDATPDPRSDTRLPGDRAQKFTSERVVEEDPMGNDEQLSSVQNVGDDKPLIVTYPETPPAFSRQFSEPVGSMKENAEFDTPPSSPLHQHQSMDCFVTPTSSPVLTRKRGTVYTPSRVHIPLLYELVGVVVHSGQATAGHYYSYIKDRRGDPLTNPNKGRWFKFNDTSVEAVEMTEAVLEHECFGGQYRAQATASSSSSLPEERSRYWSGYLVFYERCEGRGGPSSRTPATAPRPRHYASRSLRSAPSVRRTLNLSIAGISSTAITSSSHIRGESKGGAEEAASPHAPASLTTAITSPSHSLCSHPRVTVESDSSTDLPAATRTKRSPSPRHDRLARSSLSELRDLMEEGEKRGIFSQQRLPPHILASIVHHNLELYRDRSLHLTHYYDFVRALCSLPEKDKQSVTMAQSQVTVLALSFLFNTYIRLKNKSESVVSCWCSLVTSLLQRSATACAAALEFLTAEEGALHLQPLLLHAPERVVRTACSTLLGSVLEHSVEHVALNASVTRLLAVLLDLLRDAVPASVQHSQQYFAVLFKFCAANKRHCHLVLQADGFGLLMQFLLGKDLGGSDASDALTDGSVSNRWSSVQTQEFGLLHATCAELIASCDLTGLASTAEVTNVSMSSLGPCSPPQQHISRKCLEETDAPYLSVNMDVLPSLTAEDPSVRSIAREQSTSSSFRVGAGAQESNNSEAASLDCTMPSISNPNSASNPSDTPSRSSAATVSSSHTVLGYSDTSSISSSSTSFCMNPPPSMVMALSGDAVSLRWLSAVVTAYRELLEPVPGMTAAMVTASTNNRPFSVALLSMLLSQYGSAPANVLRELSLLILEVLNIDDFLHGERVVAVVEGCRDSLGRSHLGLLELLTTHHVSDVRRAYQCMKLCVTIAARFTFARDVLTGTSERWQWAVQWLRSTIHGALDAAATGGGGGAYSASTVVSTTSNEGSHTSVFQRTTSAQLTLEEATMLLSQMEPIDMETESSDPGLGDIKEDSPSPGGP